MRIDVTASAGRDLIDIWEYIAADNIVATDRVIADLQGQMKKLAEMPGIGHTRRELDEVYRVWRVYSYLIVYRPDTKPMQIVRVIHGRRDLNRTEL